MKKFGNQHFNQLLERKVKSFFKGFDKEVQHDDYPKGFADEQRTIVDSEIADTHNSSHKLNADFFEVRKLKGRKTNLTYSKVIDDYCKKTNKDQKEVFEFVVCLLGLYKIRDRLDDIIRGEEKALQADSKNKEDFTTARKVIVFSLLMNNFFENSSIPDKTKVATFIDSLVSNKAPKKNVTLSNLYGRVKELFFNLEQKAKIQDLQYVKTKFEELGMSTLVTKIELLIIERKKKKQ